jgi:selenocysteine-specific elongation factor
MRFTSKPLLSSTKGSVHLLAMKAVIVGTAGHIDHGKSALVRALTGIDPDRLEEEKRRGITIDIGFANLDLTGPSGEAVRIGFVDVPGHERFVRNMLAGVGGIDLVLLVVAADESVKPQTREHFDICRMLSVQRGITVVTKADLVDAETLEVVTLGVAEFLKGSFLDPATTPIIPVSSKTGAGLDRLKTELARLAAEVPAKDSTAVFRLPIDRVFTMKGFGTVVTGTLISGTIRKEQEVEVHPIGKRLRVRSVQVHGKSANEAIAGQRTALNLPGVETTELARGMMLTPPAMFVPVAKLGVQLDLLPSAKPLRQYARVHLHAFTAETIAQVTLLGVKQLLPGESGFARLKLDRPVLLFPGDRFIIRQYSPVITMGGGRVLDAGEPKIRIERRDQLPFLQAIANATPAEALLARINRRWIFGLSVNDAVAETGWLATRVQQLAAELKQPGLVTIFGGVMITNHWLERVRGDALTLLGRFHDENPLQSGMNKQQIREKTCGPDELFDGMIASLLREKNLEADGELLRLPGRGVVLRDEETESKQQIEQAFAKAGLQVPLLKDVLAALPVDKVRAQKIVTLLLRDRVLLKLADDLVFHRNALEAMRKQVIAAKVKTPKLSVPQFKDIFGITRKYAIPLLEYLDRERVTRRVGDERIIL